MLTICLHRKEHYARATKQVRNRDQEIVKFNDAGQEVGRESRPLRQRELCERHAQWLKENVVGVRDLRESKEL